MMEIYVYTETLGCLNIRAIFPRCGDPHVKEKTV